MQKYTLDSETHKTTMVSEYELYNFMFDTTAIGHENTYDMRVILFAACAAGSVNLDF